jgi:hypothetical protein
MPTFLVAIHRPGQRLDPLAGLLLLSVLLLPAAGCGGRREAFVGGRVQDSCDSQWPVCDRIAGCLIGGQSYVEGKFPGNNRVAIQIFEPSKVTVSFYLESVGAAGNETVISFFEDRCRARVRETVSGRTFVGEAEKVGFLARSADLSGIGDHLIEFESDAKLSYLFKVDVLPKRLEETQ